jgi:hypothetical protein
VGARPRRLFSDPQQLAEKTSLAQTFRQSLAGFMGLGDSFGESLRLGLFSHNAPLGQVRPY